MVDVHRMTFEVDRSALFDVLHQVGGDTGPLGERLVATMLGGNGFATDLGLAVYGITLESSAQSLGESETPIDQAQGRG